MIDFGGRGEEALPWTTQMIVLLDIFFASKKTLFGRLFGYYSTELGIEKGNAKSNIATMILDLDLLDINKKREGKLCI